MNYPARSGEKPQALHVCIIAMQILESSKIGGFGSMTRNLAMSLAGAGVTVTVLVPSLSWRTRIQKREGYSLMRVPLLNTFLPGAYKAIDADIYHSQNQSILSYAAMRYEPGKRHIVTCRDPRDLSDWLIEFQHASLLRRMLIPLNYLLEEGYFARRAVRSADLVGVPARFLAAKVARLYGISKSSVAFLPNLENLPKRVPEKTGAKHVCFVGRLDYRKRPELFIKLAHAFPDVTFTMVGNTENKRRHKYLAELASCTPNVVLCGFIDKFASNSLSEVYERSVVLVNTSAREGLPLTFIEALGRGCALLSALDPDGLVSKFGYVAANDNDFEKGLRELLAEDSWRPLGERGREYVMQTYAQEQSLAEHLRRYKAVLAKDASMP